MEYISLKEAAELFKVSTRTIRRWCSAGLPHVQIRKRGRVVIPKDQAVWWVSSHSYPSAIKINKIKEMK